MRKAKKAKRVKRARMKRELHRLAKNMRKLAEALYKHARTDLAPDAALPELKRLVKKLRQR